MTKWTRAIVGTNSDHDLKRLVGKLADGIVFIRLTSDQRKELKDILLVDGELNKKYQLLLLIRSDLYEAPSRNTASSHYYALLKRISSYIRISVDSQAFIAKHSNPRLTLLDLENKFSTNNIYSDKWQCFLDIYDEHKTTFELFSAATVTDRTDTTYNVMNSVISLESMLLNGEAAENSYKFRLRGAYMFASTPHDRRLIYNFLKYTYELRSAVVHSNDKLRRKIRGKLKSEYGLSLYEVNYELIKMNRFILKLFINDPDLLDNFDEIILSGRPIDEPYTSIFLKNRVRARAVTFARQAAKAETPQKPSHIS